MTWLDLADDTPFGLDNLPYGVFSIGSTPERRAGVAVGEQVLDLTAAATETAAAFAPLLTSGVLNPLLAAGPDTWREVRESVRTWLTEPRYAAALRPHLMPLAEVTTHLAFEVADYVDFYSSEQHALNVGRIFRPDATAPAELEAAADRLSRPRGHGRRDRHAGVPPAGQRRRASDEAPRFGPSRRLDIEAEVGFVVGVPARPGCPVDVRRARLRRLPGQRLVGPRHPGLGVPAAGPVPRQVVRDLDVAVDGAAGGARARAGAGPPQDPEPCAVPARDRAVGLDLRSRSGSTGTSCPAAVREQYWTAAQQLAHLTVNGASLRTGDLFASGTVTGPERDQRGSLLELTWNGREPSTLAGRPTRTFLDDGDEVVISATAPGPGGRGSASATSRDGGARLTATWRTRNYPRARSRNCA